MIMRIFGKEKDIGKSILLFRYEEIVLRCA